MSGQPLIRARQGGFILATSLIFLVVLTLLAVTAISSATLQQRMAANQSDKAALLEDANSALAYVGSLTSQPTFLDCVQAKMVDASTASGACSPALEPLSFRIGRLADAAPERFLSPAFWQQPGRNVYQPEDDTRQEVEYVVEYLDQTPIQGDAVVRMRRFRVTARARQPASGAQSVAQMIYEVAR